MLVALDDQGPRGRHECVRDLLMLPGEVESRDADDEAAAAEYFRRQESNNPEDWA